MKLFHFYGVFILCFGGFWSKCECQERLAVGQWSDLLPYDQAYDLVENEDFVFYACDGGVLKVSKADLSASIISKTDGLSDIEVRKLAYDFANDQLVVIYEDSNIDVITQDGILNLNDIVSNDNLSNKQVLDVTIWGNTLYLATGFGLVELDLNTLLFGTTTITPFAVSTVWVDDTSLTIGSDRGAYTISRSANTADFSLWRAVEDFPLTGVVSVSSWRDRQLFLTSDGALLERGRSGFVAPQDISPNENIKNLIVTSQGDLIVIKDCFRCRDAITIFSEAEGRLLPNSDCLQETEEALWDRAYGRVWTVDKAQGHRVLGFDGACDMIELDRMPSANSFEMLARDGDLIIATGGINSTFGNNFNQSGIYWRRENVWAQLNRFNNDFLDEIDLRDVIAVTYNHTTDKYYFASYWAGVLEWSPAADTSIVLYNQFNSPLTGSNVDSRIRISDVAVDPDGNVWATNYQSTKSLCVLSAEEQIWHTFEIPFANSPEKLEVSSTGIVYIGIRNVGVVAYHPGQNLASSADDQWRLLPSQEDGIPNSTILELALDRDDNLWVGTTEGVSVVRCGRDLDDCQISRPIVEPSYLLQNESVNAIAIDGANRKWFGTENGLFLQSEDGRSELFRFSEANSPLISDKIRDITIDGATGIVYIVTSQGISAFRSESTEGRAAHVQNEVYVFPNPVRPQHTGTISISNLTENAFVKVTTISGVLVHEGRSVGGQYSWNGLDQDGRKVSPGVYLVYSLNDSFSLSSSGSDGAVAKILIAR